jgi:hypothetical protein
VKIRDPDAYVWRKASRSAQGTSCVEVVVTPGVVGVRDTKARHHGHIEASPESFRAFLGAVVSTTQ